MLGEYNIKFPKQQAIHSAVQHFNGGARQETIINYTTFETLAYKTWQSMFLFWTLSDPTIL